MGDVFACATHLVTILQQLSPISVPNYLDILGVVDALNALDKALSSGLSIQFLAIALYDDPFLPKFFLDEMINEHKSRATDYYLKIQLDPMVYPYVIAFVDEVWKLKNPQYLLNALDEQYKIATLNRQKALLNLELAVMAKEKAKIEFTESKRQLKADRDLEEKALAKLTKFNKQFKDFNHDETEKASQRPDHNIKQFDALNERYNKTIAALKGANQLLHEEQKDFTFSSLDEDTAQIEEGRVQLEKAKAARDKLLVDKEQARVALVKFSLEQKQKYEQDEKLTILQQQKNELEAKLAEINAELTNAAISRTIFVSSKN